MATRTSKGNTNLQVRVPNSNAARSTGSDWVVFNSIGFQYSLYSLFGYYDANGTPIPVGDTIYYWNNINPPTNIVGYEYNSNRKRGIQTKYSYYSRKHIFFDNEMVGDTATIYTRAVWNNDIVGPKKEVLDSIQIIFE